MSRLEQMSKEAFEYFGYKHLNKPVSWSFLSNDSKIKWMEESLETCKFFIDKLRSEIRPVKPNRKTDTSFALGYQEGIRQERMHFRMNLDMIEKELDQELNRFIEIVNRKPYK